MQWKYYKNNDTLLTAAMHVGIDLISPERFRSITDEQHDHWDHVFSSAEWVYAFRDANSAQHLAALFAMKEAAMKASGEVGAKNYRTFEISHTSEGAPQLNREGMCVSVSHHEDMVVAVVIVL